MADIFDLVIDERPDFWDVHEEPSRPLDTHALICSCVDCEATLMRTAIERPRFVLGLKTSADRVLVTAEYFAEVYEHDRSLKPLLYERKDYVREIYVPLDGWLPSGARWWSLSMTRDDELLGRKRRRHRVAKKVSAAVIAARQAEWEAESEERERNAPPPPRWIPLAEAVRAVRDSHRSLLVAFGAWALERGEPVDLDVAAALIGGAEYSHPVTPSFGRALASRRCSTPASTTGCRCRERSRLGRSCPRSCGSTSTSSSTPTGSTTRAILWPSW